jgi:hypothetical protein
MRLRKSGHRSTPVSKKNNRFSNQYNARRYHLSNNLRDAGSVSPALQAHSELDQRLRDFVSTAETCNAASTAGLIVDDMLSTTLPNAQGFFLHHLSAIN